MAQNKRVQSGPFAGLTQGAADLAAAAQRYGDEWGGSLGRQVQEAAKQAAQAYQKGLELEGEDSMQQGRDASAVAAEPLDGFQAYWVNRNLFPGVPGPQHGYIAITGANGKVVRTCNYGPSSDIFDPQNRLTNLTDPEHRNPTARDDDRAWSARGRPGNPWGTDVQKIPASAAAVAAQCDLMNRHLATEQPSYGLSGALFPNSNSAASQVANGAIRREHPGAPMFTPAKRWAPGERYQGNPRAGRRW